MRLYLILLLSILLMSTFSCHENKRSATDSTAEKQTSATEVALQVSQQQQNHPESIKNRFEPPARYKRVAASEGSFQFYLRNLKLKPVGTKVKYHNGNMKASAGVYAAVVDLPIGDKDLHQCADAVMRLRAEYLWLEKKYDQIHFNFTNGHKIEYSTWMQGNRILVEGNKTRWKKLAPPSNTYESFWNYLEIIFMYAGTASLERELVSRDISDAQIGDVLIQGGYPGHAVIIVDKAIEEGSGKPIYLLAQSYMPAQEIQILINPVDSKISPWFAFEEDIIRTPEWTFQVEDLKQFEK